MSFWGNWGQSDLAHLYSGTLSYHYEGVGKLGKKCKFEGAWYLVTYI
jgi:hypothetical protein